MLLLYVKKYIKKFINLKENLYKLVVAKFKNEDYNYPGLIHKN